MNQKMIQGDEKPSRTASVRSARPDEDFPSGRHRSRLATARRTQRFRPDEDLPSGRQRPKNMLESSNTSRMDFRPDEDHSVRTPNLLDKTNTSRKHFVRTDPRRPDATY
jgi:hypothetical protein